MVTRPGAAPGASSSQARRIAVFLAREFIKMVAEAGFEPAIRGV